MFHAMIWNIDDVVALGVCVGVVVVVCVGVCVRVCVGVCVVGHDCAGCLYPVR